MDESPMSDNQRFVIGVDFGTLSARSVIINVRNGALISSFESNYDHGIIHSILPHGKILLPPDWCLQDPNDYIKALETVVCHVVKESHIPKEKIIGLSIDFTSCTILPVNKKGVPLCNIEQFKSRPHAYAKLWKHHAAQPYADEINQKLKTFPNSVNAFYGDQISAELLLPKVLQIIREDPELFTNIDNICEAGDWICRILTGNLKKSISMAGYKGMYFNELGFPDEDFFERIEVRLKNCMSSILRGKISRLSEPFGTLNEEWANRLGLCSGMPIGCPVIDSHAGIAGSGIFREGQMMIAIGTSSVQACLSLQPCASKGIVGTIRDTVVPGYYLWESGLPAVGDALTSFARLTCGQPSSFLELTDEAQKLSVGESGLISLDWWNGNKTPFINSSLSGLIVGLRLDTTRGEIFRSLIEATAFGTRNILEHIEDNGSTIDEIIACGGITNKNPFIMQVYSDTLGKKIQVVQNEQTMAVGAAIYAAVAAGSKLGGYDSIEEAITMMARGGTTNYYPEPSRHKKYSELYKIYCRLSQHFGNEYAEIMAELSQFRTNFYSD